MARVSGFHSRIETTLLWAQGLYFLATGLWPIVHIESFQWVTGPKTDHLPTGREGDHWLVMTVSVLIVAIALSLLTAALRGSASIEILVLAIASACVLTGIDVIYALRGVIPPIYLADAALEIGFIGIWSMLALNRARGSRAARPADRRRLPV